MDTLQFERLVDEGLKEIPEEFRQKMDNVAIFTAKLPSSEQRRKIALRPGWTLFGLYEGVPLSKRGNNYAMVLPDRITIFQNPIEYAARGNPETMKRIVTDTVWHEIAHHFGMSEKEVREAEARRKSA